MPGLRGRFSAGGGLRLQPPHREARSGGPQPDDGADDRPGRRLGRVRLSDGPSLRGGRASDHVGAREPRPAPSIVGLEVSFNEDATGKGDEHWSPHGHVLQLDWLSEAQESALRSAFSPSELVKRPVYYVPLDDDPQGRLYPFKPERIRRVTFLNKNDPRREPYLDTRRRGLRAGQSVALALVDHELGFSRRLLTHGIDREAVHRHLEGLGWPRDGP